MRLRQGGRSVQPLSARRTSRARRRGPPRRLLTVPVAVTQAMAGNDPVGTVYIRGNYSNLFNWMRQQSVVGFLALVCGVLVAAGLTQLRAALSVDPDCRAGVDPRSRCGQRRLLHARPGEDRRRGGTPRPFVQHDARRHPEERRRAKRAAAEVAGKQSDQGRVPCHACRTSCGRRSTPCSGWLQIIRTTDMDPATVQRALASIERNAQSQARVVEDLIELSRVVTGKLQLRTQTDGPASRR